MEENDIKKDKNININNDLLNDSYLNKDLNMELSISKNKINGSEIQSSTIFENLINNDGSIEKSSDLDNIKIIQKNEKTINENIIRLLVIMKN